MRYIPMCLGTEPLRIYLAGFSSGAEAMIALCETSWKDGRERGRGSWTLGKGMAMGPSGGRMREW